MYDYFSIAYLFLFCKIVFRFLIRIILVNIILVIELVLIKFIISIRAYNKYYFR